GNEEDEVIVGDPSFIRYDATAELAACKLVRVPLDEELRFDVDAMLAAVTDKTRLIFLANPNNPTGTMTPKEAVDRLVERIPEHV
ncbi:aminotransferase class I/II-fold pyridoxal phosphate-dependent enzyme, partial [Acinetobacter baumannii]